MDRVLAGVDCAISSIEQRHPSQRLIVVSALAEGADQLATHAVLRRTGAQLIAVLPLPQDDYRTDFHSEDSQTEFLELLQAAAKIVTLPPTPSREDAYEAGGHYVLDHSDVLLAIWDGQAPQGQGGTGAIVDEARQRRRPIAWVHAGNRRPGTMEPTSLGAEQGTVTFEHLAARDR